MTLAYQAVPPPRLAVKIPDAQSLLAAFGTTGIGVVVFAETVLGGLVWTVGLVLTGYALVVSLVPVALEPPRSRRTHETDGGEA
ncbi:hypothetical protein [Streptomyces halstedii]|uniref:hypothetical protein n=1 Tax=Streptomyces halstedii TaxID=1944 RepID=UPI0033B15496